MRGLIEGLQNPHQLLTILPGLYGEDDFAARLTGVFDDALAPIVSTLDNFPAYLDPELAPEDFVELLGSWVAAFTDPRVPAERQRLLVAAAVDLHRLRGAASALRETLRLACGVDAEVTESGGTSWSAQAQSAPPGSDVPRLVVRVPVGADEAVVRRIVEALRPANLPARIEVKEVGNDPVQ
ncbi:phage tail protein [Kribbella sandramycini]|uniref:Phage tail protein n=1 Tax=Kribbella sandramycini TaxID=60450 RepID=A0A7Y4L6N1_9ACTN|nr:phage tail protein [Kribbella sandramycini]MBB6570113.1 phage tail-like protein [Kribbella sandramycini]NOL45385.1 phage tail protein [Kribbella sandramycini]